MKKIQNKKGFTLIELLVVITIIGILATWATAVYTSQIQKSRDTVRISDLSAIQWGVEQAYQDTQAYPTALSFNWDVDDYIKLPRDKKNWQPCAKNWTINTDCWYAYKVANDTNWVEYQTYELSTAFENIWNVTSKAAVDKWNDTARLEMWITIATINQAISASTAIDISNSASLTWALKPDWSTPIATDTVIIFWS